MATKLAIPNIELTLPAPQQPDPANATASQVDLTKAVNEFSKTALESNQSNLAKSIGFMDDSFKYVRVAYGAMVIVGLLVVIAAAVKAFIADDGGEAAAAGVLGLAGVGTIASAFVLKPVESMERNAVYMPWMTLVLNTYWTRLVYFSDASKIDEQLEDAASDAAAQFKLIAESHAAALKQEAERHKSMGGSGSPGEAGKDSSADDDAAAGDSGSGGVDTEPKA